jgi:hypothetical protein
LLQLTPIGQHTLVPAVANDHLCVDFSQLALDEVTPNNAQY